MTTERFVYFREDKGSAKHNGIVSAGYTYDEIKKVLNITFAWCSPNDIFNKEIARRILCGRLSHPRTKIEWTVDNEPGYDEVISIIIGIHNDDREMIHNTKLRIPRWAKSKLLYLTPKN